jgi:hypothetical protein
MLNPGVVVNSPFLADTYKVIRRTQTLGDNGRMTASSALPVGRGGVVTMAGKGDLMLLDDSQRAENVISIVCQQELRGPTPGGLPDLIQWAGGTYRVIKTLPYPRFGQGWFKALAASTSNLDATPNTTT